MTFVDEATITIKSGRGGNGCMSFLRERSRPFGGPDGGNGGRGGHVIAVAYPQAETLLDYRYNAHQFADDGRNGQGRARHGAAGKDLVLRLPPGTEVIDLTTQMLLADLITPAQEECLLMGGRGGFGNLHFKSAGNRAPRRAEPGTKGQEMRVRLRLKLLADAGLIGLPNAGKSTLLSQLSRAKPKVADYPFTTLKPHLGALTENTDAKGNAARLRVADIPGLVEGAHTGRGLGHRFLRHIERCRTLIYVLAANDDPAAAWRTLRAELRAYGQGLESRPGVIALTKMDLIRNKKALVDKLRKDVEFEILPLSGQTGHGMNTLVARLTAAQRQAP